MQQDSNTSSSQQALSLVGTPELTSLGAADQRSSFYVMASVVAPEYKADKRAPVDMICVIDRSGSMSGDRITMAKSTVEFVVANLRHDDRLGIVTYDDSVSNHFPLRVMDETGKDAAISAIRSIAIGGSTNLCGGLVEGVTQMHKREAGRNDVASVLLFTDGQANAGYTRAEDIIKATINPDFAAKSSSMGAYGYPTQSRAYGQPQQMQMQQQMTQPMTSNRAYAPQQQQQQRGWGLSPVALQPNVVQAQNPVGFGGSPAVAEDDLKKENKDEDEKKADQPLPCTINCFGFGADHDAALLKKIADHGQGMYYYIDSTAAIAEAFADCLAGLLSVVGQDIKVTFEVPQGSEGQVKINRVFTKFRSTEIEAGRSYELALGDIQSEERRDILVDLSITSTAYAESGLPLLKTTVSYTNVITGEAHATVEHTSTIKRPTQPTGEMRNFEVDRQLNRLLAAEAMEQANEAARDGSVERAREIIKRASERIRESVSREDEFCKSLVSDLARCESGLQSQSAWAADGSKMLTNQMQAHYVQRSSNVAWAGQAAYQTSSRCAMQQNFKS